MITEEQLRNALHAAADELTTPAGGPDAIRAATRAPAVATKGPGAIRYPRIHGRLPQLAVAAAVLALAGIGIGLATSTSNTPQFSGLRGGALPNSTNTGGNNFASSSPGAVGAQGAAGTVGPIKAASPLIGAPTAPHGAAQGAQAGSSGVPAKVASSGQLTLSIGRAALDRDVSALRSLATTNGGYISSTDLTQAQKTGRGSISLSVPASSFTAVVSHAEQLGTVRTLVTKATDVTGQYNDTAARLQALDSVRTQLETLLGKAAKVSDLLAVESEIENVQTQIDELQAEQRGIDQEVTYATLTVNLQVRAAPHHTPPKPSALARAWSAAVNGFTGGLRWLLSVSGVLLFALLLAGALGLLLRVLLRRLLPRLRRRFL